eukprot:jgi/Ulvmu1/3697/UM170_0003.1
MRSSALMMCLGGLQAISHLANEWIAIVAFWAMWPRSCSRIPAELLGSCLDRLYLSCNVLQDGDVLWLQVAVPALWFSMCRLGLVLVYLDCGFWQCVHPCLDRRL